MQTLMMVGAINQQSDIFYPYIKAFETANVENILGNSKLNHTSNIMVTIQKTGSKEIRCDDSSNDQELPQRLLPFLMQANLSDIPPGKSLAIINHKTYDQLSTLQFTQIIPEDKFIYESLKTTKEDTIITMSDAQAPIDGLVVIYKQKGIPKLHCLISLTNSDRASENLYFRIRQRVAALIDADIEFFRLSFEDIAALNRSANIYGMCRLDMSSVKMKLISGITVGEQMISYDPTSFQNTIYQPLIKKFNA